MPRFFENLNQNNFSVEFGHDVSFTDYYGYQSNNITHNMAYLFAYSYNYNSSLRIPDSVVQGNYMFCGCSNLNQPIYIDPHHPNLRILNGMFSYCENFNQDVNIPSNAIYYGNMFDYCNHYSSNVYLYAKTASGEPNNYSNAFQGASGFNGNVHFMDCTPKNMVGMFASCYNLNQNIQIPNTAQNLYECFISCANLNQAIKLPNDVEAGRCFAYCNNLNVSVPIPRNSNIAQMFQYCYNLNDAFYVPVCRGGAEYQAQNSWGLFSYCDNFNASVIFENGWINIYNLFEYCNNFNYPISFPNSVTDMADTFAHCVNLNTVIGLSSNLKNMSSVFYGCESLNVEIPIPSTVERMDSVFAYCINLNLDVQLPPSLISMGSCFSSCSKLNQNIQIPSSVQYVEGAFSWCRSLNQPIGIPSGVLDMSSTFASCTNLNSPILIPSGIRAVNACFENCINMKQPIVIPSSCYNLANVCSVSGITDLTIQSAEYNYITGRSGYGVQGITAVTPRELYTEWNGSTGTYTNIPCIDTTGKSVGDTVMTVKLNRDCLLYYNEWNSYQQAYVRYNHNIQEIYFSTDTYIYQFFGINAGSGRTYDQANNYSDYTANFHDNRPSLWINESNFEQGYIKFDYCDWRNTSGGVTPNYVVYFNLI